MLPQTTIASTSSTKLVDDSASNGSSSTGGSNGKPGNGVEKNMDSANSGYSADGSVAVVPPVYIDLLGANTNNSSNSNKREGSSHSYAKKRKAVERSFTAFKAKEDLEEGGMSIPQIKIGRTRDLAGCKVDMSKVTLTMANTVSQSPFLLTRKIEVSRPENPAIYDSLFTATYQSYNKNDAFQWDSSTSSVTSSESSGSDSDMMPPPAFVVPPLLENSLKASEETKAKHAGSKRKHSLLNLKKASKLTHATLNDALEASNDARLVTLSFAPFIVVHVNTSYTSLTGYSSAKILGRPLHECIGGKCKDWLESSDTTAPHPIAALHERVSTISSKNGNRQSRCRLNASLVGPQLEGTKEVDTSSVTHYAISFLPDQQEAAERGHKNTTIPAVGHQLVMG